MAFFFPSMKKTENNNKIDTLVNDKGDIRDLKYVYSEQQTMSYVFACMMFVSVPSVFLSWP